MSQDAWFVTKGPLPAPISALPSLYEDLWIDMRTLVTREDLDGGEVNVNVVPVRAVPNVDELDVAPGSVAFNFSGRGFSHYHLPILDALAPRGGFFVYEDGDVEEIDAAAAPDLVVAATEATLARDAAALDRVLRSLPESDRPRLPRKGMARIEALDPAWRATLDLPDESDAGDDASNAEALADLQRGADAEQWAEQNVPSADTARALIAAALSGHAFESEKLLCWTERYRNVGRAERAARIVLGAALLDALEAAAPSRRDAVVEYLEELSYWEGVERLSRAASGMPEYEELIDEFRELAETEMDRIEETDFGDL
jgi:hypothetical protein